MRITARTGIIAVCIALMFSVMTADCYAAAAPGKVKTLKKSVIDCETVKLSWRKVKKAKAYTIYTKVGGRAKYRKLRTVKKRNFTYRKIIPYKATYFRVRAYRNGKYGKPSKAVFVKTHLLKTKLKASATPESVKLKWDKVRGATAYIVYRDEKKLKSLKKTEYKDTSGKEEQKYSYTVRAYKTSKKKQYMSNESNAVAIARPTKLYMSEVKAESCRTDGKSAVFLSWNDNPYADGYKVLKRGENGQIQRIGYYRHPYFMDTNVEEGQKYTYLIASYIIGKGTSAYKEVSVTASGGTEKEYKANEKAETPPVEKPAEVKTKETEYDTILLSWKKDLDCDGYRIYDNKGGFITETEDNSFRIENLSPGTEYVFRIVSVRDGKESSAVEIKSKTKEMKVTGLKAVSRTEDSVVLKWDAFKNAENYVVRDKNGEKVALTDETQYSITGLDVDTSYTYSVSVITGGAEHEKEVLKFATRPAKPIVKTSFSTLNGKTIYGEILTDEMEMNIRLFASHDTQVGCILQFENMEDRSWLKWELTNVSQGANPVMLTDKRGELIYCTSSVDFSTILKLLDIHDFGESLQYGTSKNWQKILDNYISETTTVTYPMRISKPKNIRTETAAYSAEISWDKVENADYYVVSFEKDGKEREYRTEDTHIRIDKLAKGDSYVAELKACTREGYFEKEKLDITTKGVLSADEDFVDERPDIKLVYSGNGKDDKTEFYLGEKWSDSIYNGLKKHSSGNGHYFRKNWVQPYRDAPPEDCLDSDMYVFDTGDYDNYLAVFVAKGVIAGWYTNAEIKAVIDGEKYTSAYNLPVGHRLRFLGEKTSAKISAFDKVQGICSDDGIGGPATDSYLADYSTEEQETEIGLHLINAERQSHGLKPLKLNPYIKGDGETYGAEAWAKTLVANNRWDWEHHKAGGSVGSNGPLDKSYQYLSSRRERLYWETKKASGENVFFGHELCNTIDRGESLLSYRFSETGNGWDYDRLTEEKFSDWYETYTFKWEENGETESTRQSSADDITLSQIGFGFATGYKDGVKTTLCVTYLASNPSDRYCAFLNSRNIGFQQGSAYYNQ